METLPIISPATLHDGSGTDNPHLARAIASIMNDEDRVAAFGSFVGLPDLTQATELDLDNPDLVRALNRVRAQLDDPDGVISAFQSYTS